MLQGDLRGSHPGGVTLPTFPITPVTRGAKYPCNPSVEKPYIWEQKPRGHVIGSLYGCGGWGDGGLTATFDEPVTALCLEVSFRKGLTAAGRHDENCSTGDRQHVEFWRDGYDVVELVGHQDIVNGGEPMSEDSIFCYQKFCWESDLPIKAATSWPENDAG